MSRKGLNIYKRKDGRWEARYIKSRNALGKPKYGYLYASSYREVRCDLQHTLQLQGKPSGSEERTRNSTFELVSMEWLDAFSINFMQFALVTGVRMLTIMWIPVLIQFATLLLAAVVAAASRSYLAAMLLVMIGIIAALVVAAYRSYQFWPMALVQADHPQLNAEQVMERCKAMTEGRKFDLFVFDLSYLGWNILSLLTGGILSVLYVAPYKMMATAFVYEEMKGRPVMVDDIKPSTDGNGMTLAVDPKKLMGIGSTGGKKPTSHIPAASRAAGAALEGVAGMYAGSSYPLEPNQPVILGRDPAYAKIVFSQGAQKISRRHCEVMFNSQVQKYRVTDFSSNGTYVNGSRLPANSPVLLARGTELALGDNNNIIRLS